MKYEFYVHIFFGLGILDDHGNLLSESDSNNQYNKGGIALLNIDIVQTLPKNTVDRYGMEIIRHKYLLKLDEHFYRHVLMYWECSKDDVVAYLENLANRCAELGPVWDVILGYAEDEDSDWYFPGNRVLGQVIVGHEPSIKWHVESGRDLEGLSEAFDERIVADIFWKDEEGVLVVFRGYWYAVSRAYIEERLKTHDPYYRRHVYIPTVFKAEILEDCFNITLRDFKTIPLKYRVDYLMRHFEYDGQPMLYER